MRWWIALVSGLCACATGADASAPVDASTPLDTATDAPPSIDATSDVGAKDALFPVDDGATDSVADGGPPSNVAQLTNSTGWQIFPGGGYRYGPSIIVNADKSIEMWTCSPGADGAWDYVRHRHSTDGGHTWTPDTIAIAPTKGTRDAFSACDPGAIHLGAYWYVGYTSTEDSRGTANQLYLARASAPSGPYAKWDGKGWTGAPQPIVTYGGDPAQYGVGEPSFVFAKGKLFVYYTLVDGGNQTDVQIVDAPTADDWPLHMTKLGHAIVRRAGEDSTDVKYVDALSRFVAVNTYDRFGPNATISVYQSIDGVAFEPAPFKGARVQPGAHNVGLSGDGEGHVTAAHDPFIAYAYQPPGKSWGDWPTFVDPVAIAAVPYGATVSGDVSSIVSDTDWSWSGPRAFDGDLSTLWSSKSHDAIADAPESIWVDLGKPYAVKSVTIVPRAGGLGFPVDFAIQTAVVPGAWVDVAGASRTAFPNPSSAAVELPLASKPTARFVRLVATKLGADDHGNHYLQLAELVPHVE